MVAEQAKHEPDKEGEGQDNDDSSPKHTPRATTNPEKAFEKSFRWETYVGYLLEFDIWDMICCLQ